MTEVSEKKIIEKVLGGDANAFEELVLKYEKTVYNLALRMVGDRDDAFDMTQEAFIKAYGSLSSFRGDSKFSVWIYRITTNVCLDFLRSKSRKQQVSLSLSQAAPLCSACRTSFLRPKRGTRLQHLLQTHSMLL